MISQLARRGLVGPPPSDTTPSRHPSQRVAPAALEERGRHGHHEQAHGWFSASQELGWATCPLTQNAVLRLLGQPHYPNSPGSPEVVAGQLTDT